MNKLIRSCLLAGFLFCGAILNAQSPTLALVVYFSSDSHTLSPAEQARIDSLVVQLGNVVVRDCLIKGFTDADGSPEYNYALSERRIEVVTDRLKTKDPSFKGLGEFNGENRPVRPNDTEANKRWNRRVEIWVTYEPQLPHIHTVLEKLDTYQSFCINPSRDTVLVGEDGTIVVVKANSFKTPSYQRSCLTVRLKEYLTVEDMLMAHLSTTSKGQILESGGMIYIDAIDPMGYPVLLKDGASLQISVPSTNPIPDMGLFYGHEDSNGFVDWHGDPNGGMQVIDPNGLFRENGCYNAPVATEPCPIFFCGIRRFFRKLVGRGTPTPTIAARNPIDCARAMDSLFKAYGVDNYEDYLLAVNKDLMDSLNIGTLNELYGYLAKKEEEDRMERLRTGTAGMEEMRYYAFSTSQLGWINCDRWSNLNLLAKAKFKVRLKNPQDHSVSLVFPGIKSILTVSHLEGNNVVFQDIPMATRVWVVIMKNAGNGMVDLCIKDANTSFDVSEFEFHKVSIDELREKLAGL